MITYILFDLDDTLYATSAGMMHEVSARMSEYMITRLGFAPATVDAQRKDYWARYGTTLRGLYIERQIDPQAFLRFVHDVRVDTYLQADARLEAMLAQMPQRKAIFTNAPEDYAHEVLRVLGVERHFEAIFGINFIEYQSKPTQCAYDKVAAALPVPPNACLMIDDTARNLVPAKKMGMTTAWLTSTADRYGDDGHTSADYTLATIYDVAKIL